MIGIYYIATGEYTQFFEEFLKTLNRFMPGERKVVCLMADEALAQWDGWECGEIKVEYHHVCHMPWPVVTLYKFFLMRRFKVRDAELHVYCNSNIEFSECCMDFDYGVFHEGEIVVTQPAGHRASLRDYLQGGSISLPESCFDAFCEEHCRRVNRYMQRERVVPKWHDETVMNEMLIRDQAFPFRWFPVERGLRWQWYDGSPPPRRGLCYLRNKPFQSETKNDYAMMNYLVNLASDTDRLAFQRRQAEQVGISFVRIEACGDDSSKLDRFRWWCAVLRPVVKGEIGCALSHVKAYAQIVAGGDASGAIFEDDVIVSPALPRALELARRFCEKHPKAVVLLGDHRRDKAGEPIAPEDVELSITSTTWDFCTDGYVIGRTAAINLVKARQKIHTPADAWSYFRHKGYVELYRMTPPVCGQQFAKFGTTIGERYVVAGKPFVERCWWKVRRSVGVLLDCLMDWGRCGW